LILEIFHGENQTITATLPDHDFYFKSETFDLHESVLYLESQGCLHYEGSTDEERSKFVALTTAELGSIQLSFPSRTVQQMPQHYARRYTNVQRIHTRRAIVVIVP